MLTAEIKVNGALIGHLYILNSGRGTKGPKGITYDYTAQYYDVCSGKVSKAIFSHTREDGVKKCIQRAFCALGVEEEEEQNLKPDSSKSKDASPTN